MKLGKSLLYASINLTDVLLSVTLLNKLQCHHLILDQQTSDGKEKKGTNKRIPE